MPQPQTKTHGTLLCRIVAVPGTLRAYTYYLSSYYRRSRLMYTIAHRLCDISSCESSAYVYFGKEHCQILQHQGLPTNSKQHSHVPDQPDARRGTRKNQTPKHLGYNPISLHARRERSACPRRTNHAVLPAVRIRELVLNDLEAASIHTGPTATPT